MLGSDSPTVIWTAVLLLSLFALIPLSVWARSRLGGLAGRSPQGMKVLDALSVGPKERVVVIQVADQRLLLGVTGHQIQLLSELPPAPAQPATPDTPGTARAHEQDAFSAHLAKAAGNCNA